MTIDEQRQILYAALVRHSPETGSLRDRALDRMVLVALLGSSKSSPMDLRQIHDETRIIPSSSGLRGDVIEDALGRLAVRHFVAFVTISTKTAYCLTDLGRTKTDEATESAAQLFVPVLERMLQDTEIHCSADEGAQVCRTFISECFARFGQQIARAVTGDLASHELIAGADVKGAFGAAIKGHALSKQAVESLRVRCDRFLKSIHPGDEELKFRLAQSYYVAQLLELNPKEFNPIADDAFRDSVMYIDTNVLFARVLSAKTAHAFNELVALSATLGIELRVSRATLDEVQKVAARRFDDVEHVVGTVPDELIKKIRDPFLEAFLQAKQEDPDTTLADFFGRFGDLQKHLEELNILLDDRSADEIVGNRNVRTECQIISKAAEKTRGWGKSDDVSLHDVCHYLVIQTEREGGRRAWFLTRDRTLSQAAVDLGERHILFCLPIAGFLHSVSPFVEAQMAPGSLVELFSAVLDGETGRLIGESLFDLGEVRVISELHADVLSTPADQLLPALDFVKRNFLSGQPYRKEDHTKVSLALKKFLASSAQEREAALLAEAKTQEQLAAEERAKRSDAEREARERMSEIDRLNAEIDAANAKSVADTLAKKRLWSGMAMLGSCVAASGWFFDTEIAGRLAAAWRLGADFVGPLGAAVRVLGAVTLVATVFPAVGFLKRRHRHIVRGALVACLVGASDLLGIGTVRVVSAYLTVGTTIAILLGIVYAFAGNSRGQG